MSDLEICKSIEECDASGLVHCPPHCNLAYSAKGCGLYSRDVDGEEHPDAHNNAVLAGYRYLCAADVSI